MSGGLRVEATQPDRVHLELGRQQIAHLSGLLVATLGEVLHVFTPLRGRPQPHAPSRPKVTVSAIQPLIIGCGTAKINEARWIGAASMISLNATLPRRGPTGRPNRATP